MLSPKLAWQALGRGGGGKSDKKINVAQKILKHILVLEFLKTDEILVIGKNV